MQSGTVTLKPEQAATVGFLESGRILVAGVGSGKTYVSIFWAIKQDKPIVVITTAAKRDKVDPGHKKPDWQESFDACGIDEDKYTVDSWNNVSKYIHLKHCVFVFDEHKAMGSGKWAKSFIQIAKNNDWILCTATPGDNWISYIPVFLASGFYKNRTEFGNEHIIYDRYAKFPKINAIVNQHKLERLRKQITVTMVVPRDTVRHISYIDCDFDLVLNKDIMKRRWNPYTDEPIETPAELTQTLRRAVATHPDRAVQAEKLMTTIDRLIVFYNYDFELEILKHICGKTGKPYGEWNGHRHEQIPETNQWIYLVQYNANEGWNCITTDQMMFYSPNYAWWVMEQCQGRIDRMNTPYKHLYYYILKSAAAVDNAVIEAIEKKKYFNETTWGKTL